MIQALSQSDILCNLSKMIKSGSLHFCQCDIHMHLTRARLSYIFQQTIKKMEWMRELCILL